MIMKKHEFNGRDYTRAYRRHCAKKKLKQRARNWTTFFLLPPLELDGQHIKSWGVLWEKIEKGDVGRWLQTTGKPCSCEMCSRHFVRESKSEILKQIIKKWEDEAEDSTLVD